ncbi:MAG: hypothetical protein NTY75_00565 [Candidatus Shapirobacteria bacterium]|nr:hypothetical protein [Candidatus Shapirobacteria bacterium]
MKSNQLIITLLAVVIFSGAGFFAGTKYQQSKTPSFGNFARTGQAGQMGNRAGGARGGQVIGDIMSADNNSITVKLADGSSKIVILSNTASINKAAIATTADLTVGTKVAVFGTTNTDGSVTAQNVQINPTNVMHGPSGISGTPTTGQ